MICTPPCLQINHPAPPPLPSLCIPSHQVVPLPSSEVTPPPPSSELVPEDTSLVSEVTPAQATDPTCPAPPSRQSSQGGEPWVRRPADAQQVSLWLRTDEDISRFVNREGVSEGQERCMVRESMEEHMCWHVHMRGYIYGSVLHCKLRVVWAHSCT